MWPSTTSACHARTECSQCQRLSCTRIGIGVDCPLLRPVSRQSRVLGRSLLHLVNGGEIALRDRALFQALHPLALADVRGAVQAFLQETFSFTLRNPQKPNTSRARHSPCPQAPGIRPGQGMIFDRMVKLAKRVQKQHRRQVNSNSLHAAHMHQAMLSDRQLTRVAARARRKQCGRLERTRTPSS
jgi:hypothetical protein